MRRLVLILLLVVGLAPGTFVRSPTGPGTIDSAITITDLAAREGVTGALEVTGAWHLRASRNQYFGGFSALALTGPEQLLAGSDRGWALDVPLVQGAPQAAEAEFASFAREQRNRFDLIDLEAFSQDPVTGRLWVAYENGNYLERLDPDGTRTLVRPSAMRRWWINSGAETMFRLPDGRHVVIAEGARAEVAKYREGLLFAGDPVEGAEADLFNFTSYKDYAPADATMLPDGKVLILLRRVEFGTPVKFGSALMLADPALIKPGAFWTGSIIAEIAGPELSENYEGIAYVPGPDETLESGALYLISDDNFSVFQRTLMLQLRWRGDAS